jgi:hypothetical protein
MGANSVAYYGARAMRQGGRLSSDGRVGVFERLESAARRIGQLGSARNTVTVSLEGDTGRAFQRVASEALLALKADSAGLVKSWLDSALSDPTALTGDAAVDARDRSDAIDADAPEWDVVVWLSDSDLRIVGATGLTPPDFVTRAVESGLSKNQ